MSSQNVLIGLLWFPFIIISSTAKPSFLVSIFNCFKVLFIFNCGSFRMRNKEGIMSITSWVSLRLEKSIKVPERTLNIAISLHLFETHLNQNFNKLSSCFHEEMQISIFNFKSLGFWIKFLELLLLPRTICYHCTCELCH